MYNTVQELHIGIDIGLQDIASNRKGSIKPEEKDWILNEALLQKLNSSINPKSNFKDEGYEETQKRIDDLEVLKSTATLTAVVDADHTNCISAILPQDYYLRANSRSLVSYDCNGHGESTTPITIQKCILPFPVDSGAAPFYAALLITIVRAGYPNIVFDRTNYNVSNLNKEESKFELINLVLEVLNQNSTIDVYWETYNDTYNQNSFIIVSNGTGGIFTNATLTYTGFAGIAISFTSDAYNRYDVSGTEYRNKMVSSTEIYDMLPTHYSTTRYTAPLCIMQGSRVRVFHNGTFVLGTIKMDYIRRPRKISLALNQNCELPHRAEEIVNIAVQKIKARINDANYKNIINENRLQE